MKVTSERVKVIPEPVKAAPEQVKVIPEPVKAAPEQVKVTSEQVKVTPKLVQAVPELGKAAPEVVKLTTKTSQFHAAVGPLHEACVLVHSHMTSRYRKDPASLESIARIPVQDRIPDETKLRAGILLKTWKELPLPPGAPAQPPPPPHFYIPTDNMTVGVFEGLQTNFLTKEGEKTTANVLWEKAEGALHKTQREMRDFSVNAAKQGRAQFPDVNTIERELIDSLPDDPPVTAPGTAVISQATALGPDSVKLKASCARASRFDWEQLDNINGWVTLASDVPLSILVQTGLAPGDYQFRVMGKNSRGSSEWSEPVALTL